MRFLHCSDVHVTQSYAGLSPLQLGWRRCIAVAELTVGGRAKAFQHAEQTLATIAADVGRRGADHLIVSGDLTAYAMEDEFRRARAALEPAVSDRRLCTVIPGNHDTYTPQAVKSGLFEKYFGHLLESDLPEYRAEGAFPFVRLLGTEAAVVGLRSARVPPMPGLSYGVIGKQQLGALKALLQDRRLDGRAVLVVVHHAPLNRHGLPDKKSHGLVDAQALFALLPGPRFAVLHGHIHRRYYHPPTAERPHLFGAGSSTCDGMEGYWTIDVAGGQVTGGTQHTPGAKEAA